VKEAEQSFVKSDQAVEPIVESVLVNEAIEQTVPQSTYVVNDASTD
jgi:hypothetical protein